MKNQIFLLLLLLSHGLIYAQADTYFQQEVNYDIEVALDDSLHTLSGYADIEYINNSPNDLDTIWFHLWANAFRNRSTAYTKQKLRHGNSEFYFAPRRKLGGYKEIDFVVNEETATWAYLDAKNSPDIAYVLLPKSLKSGETANFSISFTLKIPSSFSRLGHIDQSYQMTQWYPKPAVYDKEGWHTMPYLDIGEFYSEFGDFDVKIKLPENYIVASTGVLSTESEKTFLNKKINESKELLKFGTPPDTLFQNVASSPTLKTIQFTAENVHDFAWFADKRFLVESSNVILENGNNIETYTYFTPTHAKLWDNAINYVDDAVKFYSQNVGAYPYPQATAVESALSAGAGMEYPMITVIGAGGSSQSLDQVITHEVGHNWFYGILATNERDYAWLDEGFNTFYENRYMRNKYKKVAAGGLLGVDLMELLIYNKMKSNKEQPISIHSDRYTSDVNYFAYTYIKAAQQLELLEAYLGKEQFDGIMKSFFEAWKFKHPQPEDFKAHFEAQSGKKLDWFFEDMIKTTKRYDYELDDVTQEGDELIIEVDNEASMAAPFSISAFDDENNEINTQWYEGTDDEVEVRFPNGDYSLLRLNADGLGNEYNRLDNTFDLSKNRRIISTKVGAFLGVDKAYQRSLYFAPVLGFNDYDKFMLGITAYNHTVADKTFEFSVAPMFGFGSKDIVGLANFNYNIFPEEKRIRKISIGLGVKSFTDEYNDGFDYHEKYYRFSPSVQLDFHEQLNGITQQIRYRTLIIGVEEATFDVDQTQSPPLVAYAGNEWQSAYINELRYQIKQKNVLTPYTINVALENQFYTRTQGGNEQYLRLGIEGDFQFAYSDKKYFHVRGYFGTHLINSRREAGQVSGLNARGSFDLAHQGYSDYKFDNFYFGRNNTTGLWSQQISLEEGAFKTPLGSQFGLGQSNDFIFAMNVKVDLPMQLPSFLPSIRPYLDLGYFSNAQPTGNDDTFDDQFLFSGGIALEMLDERIGIYFPLFNSDNISSILEGRGGYGTRISFFLDLNRMNPLHIRENVVP